MKNAGALTLRLGEWVALKKALTPSFTCPDCGCTSHNPNDAAQRYCGACKKFFDR